MSQRYTIAKRITETGQYGYLEGFTLDVTTAQAMVTVYEALAPHNQARFDALPLERLMRFVWKMVH